MVENKPAINLTKIFNTFAKKAVKDFPELANELVIYHAPTDTLHGNFNSDQKENLLEIAQKSREQAMGRGLRAGALHPSAYGRGHYLIGYFSGESESHATVSRSLRHELGHLIAPCGVASRMDDYNFSECVAETFSVLYKQPRAQWKQQIETSKHSATRRLVEFDDVLNFNFPVLQALEELSISYSPSDIAQTPVQAANTSYRLSLLYAPSFAECKKLAEIFKPVRQAYDSDDLIAALKACKGVMFEDHGKISPMVFMTAKAWITGFLGTKYGDFDMGEYIQSKDFWNELHLKMEEKDIAIQKEAKAPEQRLIQEAKDMMALGRFDKNPDKKIDPGVYESKQHMAYLQCAMNAYTAIRYFQETGKCLAGSAIKSEAAGLSQEQVISLARNIADQRPAPKAHFAI